jgi:hypothetical protein
LTTISQCPVCKSSRLYPSRLRSGFERLRRAFTERQPYRCHACNYRGWYPMAVPSLADDHFGKFAEQDLKPTSLTAEDLDRLDSR